MTTKSITINIRVTPRVQSRLEKIVKAHEKLDGQATKTSAIERLINEEYRRLRDLAKKK